MEEVSRSTGRSAAWLAEGSWERVGIWFRGFISAGVSCGIGHCAGGGGGAEDLAWSMGHFAGAEVEGAGGWDEEWSMGHLAGLASMIFARES